jgi:hypothetical protein
MPKQNCWEFKKCGRQVGGDKVKELGTCSTAVASELDGTHGGKNAGRACWIVAGTLCGGKAQGTFAAKFASCELCEFYQAVRKEEGLRFKMSPLLLKKIRKE